MGELMPHGVNRVADADLLNYGRWTVHPHLNGIKPEGKNRKKREKLDGGLI
jgi:hypothetical protein